MVQNPIMESVLAKSNQPMCPTRRSEGNREKESGPPPIAPAKAEIDGGLLSVKDNRRAAESLNAALAHHSPLASQSGIPWKSDRVYDFRTRARFGLASRGVASGLLQPVESLRTGSREIAHDETAVGGKLVGQDARPG